MSCGRRASARRLSFLQAGALRRSRWRLGESGPDWWAFGFEIIQSHYLGWEMQPADAIADFGFHACLVVGELTRSAQTIPAPQPGHIVTTSSLTSAPPIQAAEHWEVCAADADLPALALRIRNYS